MRFVLYNIRYATGPKFHNFVRPTGRNLSKIGGFLRELQPDLIGLVEIDYGSYRTGHKNQVELLASSLGHYHSYSTKYGETSFWRHIPILNRQGNAFLARDRIRNESFHFFDQGMKRLVMELEMDHLIVYLVHLSLGARTRHQQLSALYDLVSKADRPFILAGDFNMLWGEQEIDLFLAATGLQNANVHSQPTYPSHNPTQHLDFVLHSKDITIRDFDVPQVSFSDHLPVVVDFDVNVAEDQRRGKRDSHCYCYSLDDLSGGGIRP